MEHREICICAEVRHCADGRVIRGHRHSDAMRTAHALVEWQKPGSWEEEERAGLDQGFVTSNNRYVGRDEGMRLQLAAGIESKGGGYRGTLFSEDLY